MLYLLLSFEKDMKIYLFIFLIFTYLLNYFVGSQADFW